MAIFSEKTMKLEKTEKLKNASEAPRSTAKVRIVQHSAAISAIAELLLKNTY